MVLCADSVKGESSVMISYSGRIVAGTTDVGVVALKEWYSEYSSAYMCLLDCGVLTLRY